MGVSVRGRPSVGRSIGRPVCRSAGRWVGGWVLRSVSLSLRRWVRPSVGRLAGEKKAHYKKASAMCVCVCTHGEHFVQNTEGRSIVISQLNSNKMGQRHRPYVFVPARVRDGMTPTFLRSDLHVSHGTGQVARVATGAEGAVEIDM